jgi:hypothetical protein
MRLRRKNDTAPTEDVESEATPESSDAVPAEAPAGPVDVTEMDPDAVYIDLGSLLVRPHADLDLRLQVEEESGTVLSVLLVAEEGVLEMRAFASSRGGDLWTDVRREIAADSTQRGGTATEQEGPFGTELYCEVPVSGPNGEPFVQPSRVIGCTGPRWFVRATIAGRPAQDTDYAAQFEDAIRTLAVRRGTEAMAPGEPLALRLPPEARPQTPEEAAVLGDSAPDAD